jgi:uncharacterized surface protein with fasciclin (FAS1) repeats
MTPTRRMLVAFAASAATLAGTPAAMAAVPADPAIRVPPADKNIVQTAVSAGKFQTLTSLLKKAGLAATLRGRGPFTVFAPTDAAFAKVPKATLGALAADKVKLRAVLTYHVAPGRLTATRVVERRSIKTLNGRRLRVRVRSGRVYVGGARVTKPDVLASNGVIHVIDKVLIPR